jgi:TonB family protein
MQRFSGELADTNFKTNIMKNLILLTCMLFSVCVFAQETTVKKSLEEVQVSPPEFTGIENVATVLKSNNSKVVTNYLAKNVQYPDQAINSFDEGTSVIQFMVTEEGNLADFEIINSVSKSIDNEVIRALKTTNGMWKPGLNNGEPTAMQKEVSMLFKIDESDAKAIIQDFTEKAIHHFDVACRSLFYKHNAKKALRHYTMATKYLPNDGSLLTLRGLCKYELGDKAGAEKDWNRINKIANNSEAKESNINYLSYDASGLKGNEAMKSILGN